MIWGKVNNLYNRQVLTVHQLSTRHYITFKEPIVKTSFLSSRRQAWKKGMSIHYH